MRPTLLLEPFRLGNVALLAMFSSIAFAQGGGNNNDDEEEEEEEEVTTQPPPANTRPTPTRGNNDDDETTTTPARTTRTTTSDRDTTTTTPPAPVITGINQPDDDGNTSPPPSLTGANNNFSYPPPAVPPTINAPFMQRSSMPDGSVFIIVGAILGAFGLAVLVWRAVVACLLHRSVARAAAAQHRANEKSTFMAPPAAFYKNNDRESSPTTRGTRRTTRGPIPSGTPSQSNLFFSPTAAGSAAHGGNRDSRYLPSGFYAAGASPSPAMGQPPSAMGYSNLRPDSRGQYSRNTMREPSPEGSPQFAVRGQDPSMSSLNLNRPPSQRAPSAYLDDLLDENPGMFPPQQMPPQNAPRHNPTFSHSSQGRH